MRTSIYVYCLSSSFHHKIAWLQWCKEKFRWNEECLRAQNGQKVSQKKKKLQLCVQLTNVIQGVMVEGAICHRSRSLIAVSRTLNAIGYINDMLARILIPYVRLVNPIYQHNNAGDKAVQLLIEHDINVNNKNFMGDTPLLLALKNEATCCIINQLLEARCDVNIKNNMEDTALHFAVKYSTAEIVQSLIDYEADINAQDGSLFTPLHQAVYDNKLTAVCMLLYYNADTSLLCHNGLTPFMYSVLNLDALEITYLLFPYYYEFTEVTLANESTFQLAVRSKNPIGVDLIKIGANCGYLNTDTREALLYALNVNRLDLFELIISKSSRDSISVDIVRDVLIELFTLCTIPSSFVLKYFYLLFEVIIENPFECYYPSKYYIINLLQHLKRNKIDLCSRKCVLWTFLSTGITIKACDLKECFSLFGNQDEIEILYQCYNVKHEFIDVLPLHYFYGILNYQNAQLFKRNLEIVYVTYIARNNETIKDLHYSKYLSFSPDGILTLSSLYTPLLDQYHSKLSSVVRFPSLLELSRNSCALHIVHIFKINHTYQFFDVVNRANIPKCIKEILLFKTPVFH